MQRLPRRDVAPVVVVEGMRLQIDDLALDIDPGVIVIALIGRHDTVTDEDYRRGNADLGTVRIAAHQEVLFPLELGYLVEGLMEYLAD